MASETYKKCLDFAREHVTAKGYLPIVMDMEIYEFFGRDRVKIIEVNMFNELADAEVVIEDGWGERKQVEMSELSLV